MAGTNHLAAAAVFKTANQEAAEIILRDRVKNAGVMTMWAEMVLGITPTPVQPPTPARPPAPPRPPEPARPPAQPPVNVVLPSASVDRTMEADVFRFKESLQRMENGIRGYV